MGLKGYRETRLIGKMLMVAALLLVAVCGGLLMLLQAIYPVNPPQFAGLICLGFPAAILLFIFGMIFAYKPKSDDEEQIWIRVK